MFYLLSFWTLKLNSIFKHFDFRPSSFFYIKKIAFDRVFNFDLNQFICLISINRSFSNTSTTLKISKKIQSPQSLLETSRNSHHTIRVIRVYIKHTFLIDYKFNSWFFFTQAEKNKLVFFLSGINNCQSTYFHGDYCMIRYF